jgi:hypothetical protein
VCPPSSTALIVGAGQGRPSWRAVAFGAVFLLVVRAPVIHDLLLQVFLRLFGWLFTLRIL